MKQSVAAFAYAAYLKEAGEEATVTYEDVLATVSPEMSERGDLLADFVLLEIEEAVGRKSADDLAALQEAINVIQHARDQLWAVEQALYGRRDKLLQPKPSERHMTDA